MSCCLLRALKLAFVASSHANALVLSASDTSQRGAPSTAALSQQPHFCTSLPFIVVHAHEASGDVDVSVPHESWAKRGLVSALVFDNPNGENCLGDTPAQVLDASGLTSMHRSSSA